MGVMCKICSKEFKTAQGLRGHKTFVHGVRSQHTRAATVSANEHQPIELTDGLANTGNMNVPRESGQLENRPNDTEEPYSEQLSKLATQVIQHTEQLNEITEQLELCRVAKANFDVSEAEHVRQTEQLRREWENTLNSLLDSIGQNDELIKETFSKVGDGADATKNQLTDLSKIIEQLEFRTHSMSALVNQHEANLNAMSEKLAGFENELSSVRNLAWRQPTGNIVNHWLSDQRKQSFKEYRVPEGLTEPYKYSYDPILGDRWIDLSEPED